MASLLVLILLEDGGNVPIEGGDEAEPAHANGNPVHGNAENRARRKTS